MLGTATAGNALRAVGGSQAASSYAKDATTLLTFKKASLDPTKHLPHGRQIPIAAIGL